MIRPNDGTSNGLQWCKANNMPEIEKIRTQSLNNCVGCWFILRPYVLIGYVTRLPRNLCVCILNHVWWQELAPAKLKVWWLVWKSKSWSTWRHYLDLRLSEVPSGPSLWSCLELQPQIQIVFFSTVLVDLLAVSDGIDSIDMVNSFCLKPMCQCAIDFPKDQETEPGFLQSKQRWQARMRSEWQGASNNCCT